MGYLEKIFLGCMALFALFILFIFGLYFDLGEMFRGGMDRSGTLTRGAAVDRVVDRLETVARSAPAVEERARSGRRSLRSAPSFPSTRTAVRARWERIFKPPTPSLADRVEKHRRFLVKQGFVSKDFIEMEALAQNRTVPDRVIPRVRRLLADGDFEGATAALEQALTEVEPANLKIRQELIAQLAEIQFMAGDLEGAQKYTALNNDALGRILDVQSRSELMKNERGREQVDRSKRLLEERRAGMEKAFEELRKRKAETGAIDGFRAEEKTQLKVALRKAADEGKLSREEYQEVVEGLDGGFLHREEQMRALRDRAAKALGEEAE